MNVPTNMFGTDGIRDRAGSGYLTAASLDRLGLALASFVREGVDYLLKAPKVLIGRDTRESGPEIEAILAAALGRRQCVVESVGVVPTPAVSYLVNELDYDLGIVISASHNPPDFNGVKVFDRRGRKLDIVSERRITALYHDTPDLPDRDPGAIVDRADLVEHYLSFLKSSLGPSLAGISVVLDCAFGATAPVADRAFRALGAETTTLNTELDGSRINVECGSLNPGLVGAEVVKRGAHLGIAFDGDGDRAICVDETGAVVDGDEVMALWALALRDAGELRGDLLVTTVMSNAGMESYLREQGIAIERTAVGDREVYQAMERRDAVLGGEQSGHIIDRRFAVTGDGIRTGASVAQLVQKQGKPLSELKAPVPRFPQVLLGVEVTDKVDFRELTDVAVVVTEVERQLDGRGRLLLRYSGTEPLARILIEGPDPDENQALAERLAESIRSCERLH